MKLTENEKRIAQGAFKAGWAAACFTIADAVQDPGTAQILRGMAATPAPMEVGDDKHPEGNRVVWKGSAGANSAKTREG